MPERTGQAVTVGDAEWLSVFTVHRRLADRYRNGRILIAGDAAHAHAPFGGQGMLTGIGDAENLAFKLALVVRKLASDKLIDTYEAERRPLATEVLRGTSAVTRVNVASNRIGRFLRDHVTTRLFGLAFIQRWTTYTASQLWVTYRRGRWAVVVVSRARAIASRICPAPGGTALLRGCTVSSAGGGRCCCPRSSR